MKLDENFTVKGKDYEWSLYYSKETDIVNPKTGKLQFTTNQWHYPSLKMVLKKYMDEALKSADDLVALNKRLDEVEEVINKLKITK